MAVIEPNEAQALEAIILNQPISRASLAKVTQLSKAAITSFCNRLLEKKLIVETSIGKGSKKGGPKPINLSFNPTSGCCLSIEVGNHKLIGAVSYLNGEPIHFIHTRDRVRANNAVEMLTSMIDALIQQAPETFYGIVGLTLAIHGVVAHNKIVFTPYSDLDSIDLQQLLTQHYHFPVWLENEANLVVLGEHTFYYPHDHMIAISCHSGIGAGILLNDKIYQGSHSQAGEFGHTILYPNGISCPCGNKGCLEQYASIKALLELFKQKKENPLLTLEDLMTALHQHDAIAHELMLENAQHLAIGITNITLLYNPKLLVLNNPIYHQFPQYLDILKSHVKTNFLTELQIESDNLGPRAAVYGGLSHATSQFLGIASLLFPDVRP